MSRLALIAALAFAALPVGALAAQPSHPTTPASTNASTTATTTNSASTKPPTVLWVLRGTLSKYTAASGSTDGSVSITVGSSNFASKTLKGSTLTFAVSSKTKVVLHDGKAIADGDRGIVQVRAQKGSDATALQTHSAFAAIDQGTSS